MKRIKLTLDEVQWSIAKGILEEEGVSFSIINEYFSSLHPGLAKSGIEREILVADEDYEEAYDLLHEFFNSAGTPRL